jgi:hypothetical protein
MYHRHQAHTWCRCVRSGVIVGFFVRGQKEKFGMGCCKSGWVFFLWVVQRWVCNVFFFPVPTRLLNATKAFGADGARWEGARATRKILCFLRTLEFGPRTGITTNILIQLAPPPWYYPPVSIHFSMSSSLTRSVTLLFVSPPLSLCSRPVVSFSYPLPT